MFNVTVRQVPPAPPWGWTYTGTADATPQETSAIRFRSKLAYWHLTGTRWTCRIPVLTRKSQVWARSDPDHTLPFLNLLCTISHQDPYCCRLVPCAPLTGGTEKADIRRGKRRLSVSGENNTWRLEHPSPSDRRFGPALTNTRATSHMRPLSTWSVHMIMLKWCTGLKKIFFQVSQKDWNNPRVHDLFIGRLKGSGEPWSLYNLGNSL